MKTKKNRGMMAEDVLVLSRLFQPKDSQLILFGYLVTAFGKDVLHFETLSDFKDFLVQNPRGQFTVFNFSSINLDVFDSHSNLLCQIDFAQADTSKNNFFVRLVNNPNGTIRWLWPDEMKKPDFLDLYNGNGLRARIIKSIYRWTWALGAKRWVTDGCLSVRAKTSLPIAQFLQEEMEGWALFTGTVGDNRKLVLKISKHDREKYFVKIPLTSNAEKLLENEYERLNFLSDLPLKHSAVPQVKKVDGGLQLSDVKPAQSQDGLKLGKRHLNALAEWYASTAHNVLTEDLRALSLIEQRIFDLFGLTATQNSLRISDIQATCADMYLLFNKMKNKSAWMVGLAHGDFTPWNLFVGKDKIHVYDWELADDQVPFLFDAFHFIFQTGVLIKKEDYGQIKQRLAKLEKTPKVQEICQRYQLDFRTNLQFYLVYTVSYYLGLYAKQRPLHQQANWLLACWQEALEEEVADLELVNIATTTKEEIPKTGTTNKTIEFIKH